MAKASVTLPNGTVVQVEGTPEEVQKLLEFYGGHRAAARRPSKRSGKPKTTKAHAPEPGNTERASVDLTSIVNLAKTCDEAEAIEKTILDRSSQVNRTLLPLYIVHEYLDGNVGLSSGDVTKVTRDLGVPVSQPNASTTLSTTASKYVMGDVVRKKGATVRYKLSRRGLQYMKAVIGGTSSDG
jgi:hypothetical protein